MFSLTEIEHSRRNGLLNALQRSFSKNIRVLNDGKPVIPMLAWNDDSYGKSATFERKCSVCSYSVGPDNSCEEPVDDDDDRKNSMAIVPVQKIEGASSSISLLLRELPEVKPGWPLLRRAIMSNGSSSFNSQVRQMSVVQWAMRLPSRYFTLSIEDSPRKDEDSDHDHDHDQLDGETGAMVPVGNETVFVPCSPSRLSRSIPEELEGLHEKYSATCRLFQFKELESATSNFQPGSSSN